MFRFNCEVKDLCVQKNMRDLKNACSFRYNPPCQGGLYRC